MTVPRLLRCVLLGTATISVLSCADSSSVVAGPRATRPADLLGGLLGGLAAGLVQCQPMPYDSVSQAVGPEGGTIRVGGHSFVVPAGALDDSVVITAVAPSENVRRVRFQPEGLEFGIAAQLTLSYENCSLLGSLLPKRVAHVAEGLTILEYLASVDNLVHRTVTGSVHHFSDYAIAW